MGKKKYIETPERMYELFEQYKKEAKSKPRKENFFYAKEGKQISVDRETPLTMEGFENYVAYLDVIQSLDQYFSNQDDLYKDYMCICSRIRREIRQDQIEGGMAGIYNPSITQRLNALVDAKDITSKGKQINTPIYEVREVIVDKSDVEIPTRDTSSEIDEKE